MHSDTIHNVPDDCYALGRSKVYSGRYNGFDFTLEVVSHPANITSNERAKMWCAQKNNLSQQMADNIRRSAKGLGMGQALTSQDALKLQNGEVRLKFSVYGVNYDQSISVTPDGDYTSRYLTKESGSLRDAVSKVMDAAFERNGVDNVYRGSANYGNSNNGGSIFRLRS